MSISATKSGTALISTLLANDHHAKENPITAATAPIFASSAASPVASATPPIFASSAVASATPIKATILFAAEALNKTNHALEEQDRREQLFQEILSDHPDWRVPVEAWNNVTLEDKIWLLQLYELHNLGVRIHQIHYYSNAVPSATSVSLLESNTKQTIINALSKVEILNLREKNLQKCPKAIHLLVNLYSLDLCKNKLTYPPDVSQNVNLLELHLNGNKLTIPPDVTRNFKLESLLLCNNELTIPPDVSRNVDLDVLHLSSNKLTSSPDVTQNVKLTDFDLSNNKLTTPPDVRRNVKLLLLVLNKNQLKDAPDISQNPDLRLLYLPENPLTTQTKEALTKLKTAKEKDKEELAKPEYERLNIKF